jgi:hypothetical protein
VSLVEKYLHGWQFRSTTPNFEVGGEYQVALTGYDETERAAVARADDPKSYVDDTDRDYVDTIAQVRVTEFDRNDHIGRGTLLEVVGETTY